MNEKTEKIIENLQIYECELLNFTEDVKQLQSNPKRMIIASLITSLESATAQIKELINELTERP